MTTAGRTVRTERASSTQEAILVAAERLYAEHGMFAVSNRQVSEAAGQGNNAAVGYHFGTKACLVRALTDHLAELGNPTWYARFAAQAMTDPAYYNIIVKGALSSPSLVQVVEGINGCLPNLPAEVRFERNVMARNLLMHTCADRERALAAGSSMHQSSWRAAASGLIDAIVGLWLAPATPDE